MSSEYDYHRPADLSDAEWQVMLQHSLAAQKKFDEERKRKRESKKAAKKMASQVVAPHARPQNMVITGQVLDPIAKIESAPIRNETFSLEQLKDIYNSFKRPQQELVKIGHEYFNSVHERPMSPEEVFELYKLIGLMDRYQEEGLRFSDLTDIWIDALTKTFGSPAESSPAYQEEKENVQIMPLLSPGAEVAQDLVAWDDAYELFLEEAPDMATTANDEAQLIAPVARRALPVTFEQDARGVFTAKAAFNPEELQGVRPGVITDEEYQKRDSKKSSLYPYHFLRFEYNRPNSSSYDSYLNKNSWVPWGLDNSHWAYDPGNQEAAEQARQEELKRNLETKAVPVSKTTKGIKAIIKEKNKQGYATYAGEGTRGGKDVQHSWADPHKGIYRPTEQIKPILGGIERAESLEYRQQYPPMTAGPRQSLMDIIKLNPQGLEKAPEIGRPNDFPVSAINPALLIETRSSAKKVTSIEEDEAAANKKYEKQKRQAAAMEPERKIREAANIPTSEFDVADFFNTPNP